MQALNSLRNDEISAERSNSSSHVWDCSQISSNPFALSGFAPKNVRYPPKSSLISKADLNPLIVCRMK